MIDSCGFGTMSISGETYSSDLMILPNTQIISPWWRDKGHRLCLADIEPLLAATPDIIVVGTGVYGLMRPRSEIGPELAHRNIQWVAAKTKFAVKEFNKLKAAHKHVGACFHLTC